MEEVCQALCLMVFDHTEAMTKVKDATLQQMQEDYDRLRQEVIRLTFLTVAPKEEDAESYTSMKGGEPQKENENKGKRKGPEKDSEKGSGAPKNSSEKGNAGTEDQRAKGRIGAREHSPRGSGGVADEQRSKVSAVSKEHKEPSAEKGNHSKTSTGPKEHRADNMKEGDQVDSSGLRCLNLGQISG